ncbi:RNA polymerase sigma factor (sigma-70 family) [Janthinobacterium sp. K2Li3]|nr:RNA polymerase sigma factor (sigma-70 family) [Janthinobacterium sp. K2C7]MBB5379558.1 RNA polymerase sigma factor (sigma-70 family) [Janthinobacterium sp. K2Li3]MBB5386346.1 RNA polymerase sigma factor (sigma-70 family) [Janthinobacterium sp. K2E3]
MQRDAMPLAEPLRRQEIATLYADHHGWLQGWLRKKMGSPACAADLAQDTFVRLLDREEAVAAREPRAFLATVAQRVLCNHYRRQKLELAYLDLLAQLPAQHAPSPEERALLLSTLFDLDHMLDGLPLPVRRAFLLRQLDELPQQDIARQLGISLATVKRHLQRADYAAQAWQNLQTQHAHLPLEMCTKLLRACARQQPKRRQAIKSLCLLLFSGASLYALERQTPWRSWTADYRTGVNQRRVVMLADGTELTLNTNSAVNIEYSGEQRRIALLAGEIFIATGKDAVRRPFFVNTPYGSLQALGTRFTVRLHDTYASAGVLEGAVAVLDGDDGQRVVLHPGEGARYDRVDVHRQALPAYGGAWLNGMLVVRDMRLADFLAELSRYSAYPLACAPGLANLRVSGSYPLADVDAILDTLCASLQLRRDTVTRFWGHQMMRIELAQR